MDDYQISKDMQRGQQARELLEHPLLTEAFLTIETEMTNIWKTTKTHETELREQSFLSLKALQRLQNYLIQTLNDGKIASAELELKRTRQEQKAKASR